MTDPNADTYSVDYPPNPQGGWPREAYLQASGGAIESEADQFIYIDAGLWAGSRGSTQAPKRNFALVYGNWAVQGDFVESGQGSFRADGQNRAIYDSNVKP